jgi:hypothetical protein
MAFEIESGVPMPKVERSFGPRESKYPWTAMDKVGDSFHVPLGNLKSLRTTAYAAGKRLGMKFKARVVDGGVRVWRTE